MTKEIDITKYKITAFAQIIAATLFVALIVLAFIFDKSLKNILIYIGCIVFFFLINVYIHELCHYIVGRLQRFNCTIKFGMKLSECRVDGEQTFLQVILFSMAPAFLYLPVSVGLLLSRLGLSQKLIVLALLICCLGGMTGDFIYVFAALKNRGGKFTDNGHTLVIKINSNANFGENI